MLSQCAHKPGQECAANYTGSDKHADHTGDEARWDQPWYHGNGGWKEGTQKQTGQAEAADGGHYSREEPDQQYAYPQPDHASIEHGNRIKAEPCGKLIDQKSSQSEAQPVSTYCPSRHQCFQ